MLVLLLIFAITAASLIVVLWAGTVFFQGYIYTEPTQEVYWQAPAAGGALALFITLWCAVIAGSEDATTTDIPYDTLFRFSPRVEKYREPVKELWVTREGQAKPIRFERERDRGKYRYKGPGGWPHGRIKSIEIKDKEETLTLLPQPASGDFQEYVGDGWVMKVYGDGPTGIPEAFRWGRFFVSLFFNFLHLALWFVCLWLLLRFQWGHALGLGFIMWLVMTLVILPMLLEQAAIQAQKTPSAATKQAAS